MPLRTGSPSENVAPGPRGTEVNRSRVCVTLYSTIRAQALFPGPSAAGRAPRVDVGTVGGVEKPVVAVRAQGQGEHAERVVPADLAVRLRIGEAAQVTATRADDELRHALLRRRPPRVALRGEPFVAVLVPVEHDVHAGVLQHLPQARYRLVVPVLAAGGEPRAVHRRQRAADRVCREV